MKWKLRAWVHNVKFWWEWRCFRRNQVRLRNVAAWAVHHHATGGSLDCADILQGHADRRIKEASDGRVGRVAEEWLAQQLIHHGGDGSEKHPAYTEETYPTEVLAPAFKRALEDVRQPQQEPKHGS